MSPTRGVISLTGSPGRSGTRKRGQRNVARNAIGRSCNEFCTECIGSTIRNNNSNPQVGGIQRTSRGIHNHSFYDSPFACVYQATATLHMSCVQRHDRVVDRLSVWCSAAGNTIGEGRQIKSNKISSATDVRETPLGELRHTGAGESGRRRRIRNDTDTTGYHTDEKLRNE